MDKKVMLLYRSQETLLRAFATTVRIFREEQPVVPQAGGVEF